MATISTTACSGRSSLEGPTATATTKATPNRDAIKTEVVAKLSAGELKLTDAVRRLEEAGFTADEIKTAVEQYVKGNNPTAQPQATKPANTPTTAPAATPANAPTTAPARQKIVSNYDLRAPKEAFEHNGWKVQTYEGTTDQITNWFKNPVLKAPAPALWPSFPNVPNPAVPGFRVVNGSEVPDGLEYGLDERNFCDNDICDMVVDARSYHLVSGDYDLGFASCKASKGMGCAIAVFNVGNETANFEDIHVNNGFSLTGRYWNGDTLWWALWGLSSHVSANMLNFPTNGAGNDTLNKPDRTNAGTNCSVPDACGSVQFTFAITSGNHVVLIASTTVTR